MKPTRKQAPSVTRFRIRKLLAEGRLADAEAYATRFGITVDDAKFVEPSTQEAPPVDNAHVAIGCEQFAASAVAQNAEPVTTGVRDSQIEPATSIVSAQIPQETPTVNGWPVESEAEVFRECTNKRLIVIRLPDGRESSMYRGYKCPSIGAKINVRLVEATADPIYEAATDIPE